MPLATVTALSLGAVIQHRLADQRAEPSRLAGCASVEHVSLSAPIELAPVLQAVTDALDHGGCVDYRVAAEPSQVTARAIARGSAEQPMVWLTDSPVWVDRVNEQREGAYLVPGRSLATSPIGVLVPAGLTGVRAGAVSAATLAQGLDARMSIADPTASTASAFFLAGLESWSTAQPQSAPALSALARHSARVSSTDGQLKASVQRGVGTVLAYPASEQQMYAVEQAAPDQRPSATFIAPAAPRLDYRLVPVVQGAGAASAAAVSALTEALTSPKGVAQLTNAGFRVDGETACDIDGFMGKLPPQQPVYPALTG